MKLFHYLMLCVCLAPMTSCLGNDDEDDYTEWRDRNIEYINQCEQSTINGQQEYTKFAPLWAPGTYVLIKWHNDRSLTQNRLSPLDNSTVDVIYSLSNIDSVMLDNSFSQTQYGDSIYRCKPYENVTGFWAGLTQMHIGDSVTMVMPYTAGYGATSYQSIEPYSTLIFNVKMVGIPAYELPD